MLSCLSSRLAYYAGLSDARQEKPVADDVHELIARVFPRAADDRHPGLLPEAPAQRRRAQNGFDGLLRVTTDDRKAEVVDSIAQMIP